jgi:hypothetical protein
VTAAAATHALRVALSAAPRLLADGLRSILSDHGVDVTVVIEPTDERFDVAIVTADSHAVLADLTIVLHDSEEGDAAGTVSDATGQPVAELVGVRSLIEFLRSR